MRSLRDTSVLFVSDRIGHSLSRAERRWLPLMAALQAAGVQVLLVTTMRGPLLEPARELGVTIARVRVDRLNILITRNRLRAYLKRYVPSVAVATGYWADIPLRLAARDLPVKVVSDVVCGGWPQRGLGPFGTLIRRRVDRRTRGRVDAFATDCGALAELMIADGVPAERVRVLGPGVDLARVAREAAAPALLGEGGPVVGYAGALERSRGLHTLAAAAHAIRERRPGARVIVAGDGPSRLGLLPASLEGRIELVGTVESVPAMLAAFDVCVFPSIEPGAPSTLMEAAALGRPIVASDVPGVADAFTDGREIVLVPPGDPAALAHAIADLLDDPNRARALGRGARARAVDDYSAANLVTRWVELLRHLNA